MTTLWVELMVPTDGTPFTGNVTAGSSSGHGLLRAGGGEAAKGYGVSFWGRKTVEADRGDGRTTMNTSAATEPHFK